MAMLHPGSAGGAALLQSTRTLLDRIRDGDVHAREDLFRRFHAPLSRFLHGRLPLAARGLLDTQDAVQDVCAKVFRSLARFDHRGVGAFWAYLRQAALNYLRDLARTPGKLSRAVTVPEDSRVHPAAPHVTPIAGLARREDLEAFETALHVLDERARAALLLRLELDLDFASIAADCGFPSPDAARMAVTRALARVSREMAGEGSGDP